MSIYRVGQKVILLRLHAKNCMRRWGADVGSVVTVEAVGRGTDGDKICVAFRVDGVYRSDSCISERSVAPCSN